MPTRILLVDDDPALVEMVGEFLNTQGFEVVAVGDGQQALERVQEIEPQLIILDLILPGLNGYSVCSVLKKDPRFQSVPVIIFSKRLEETEEELKLLCGADAYVQKPFRAQVLMAKINDLLKKSNPSKNSPANDENSPV